MFLDTAIYHLNILIRAQAEMNIFPKIYPTVYCILNKSIVNAQKKRLKMTRASKNQTKTRVGHRAKT